MCTCIVLGKYEHRTLVQRPELNPGVIEIEVLEDNCGELDGRADGWQLALEQGQAARFRGFCQRQPSAGFQKEFQQEFPFGLFQG